MDVDDPTIDALLDAIAEAPGVRLVSVVCTSTGPLMVRVDGYPTPVPAESWSGHVFAPADTGRALWSPPSKPVCFKVT